MKEDMILGVLATGAAAFPLPRPLPPPLDPRPLVAEEALPRPLDAEAAPPRPRPLVEVEEVVGLTSSISLSGS